MSELKRGKQSFILNNPPVITHWANVAGKKESEGPLSYTYDIKSTDTKWGQPTWEQSEKYMQQLVLHKLMEKSNLKKQIPDLVISGDLLNQCIGSSFSLRNTGIPHLGLYGACSTMAEGLITASIAVGGGFVENAAVITSSHFASAERQYRFPLGYGGQRTPTSQWTVTGSGAALVCNSGIGPKITSCTIGTVCDLGITDANNMGAAMAPAAKETIIAHFSDLNTKPEDYDLIVTGDLGQLGQNLLRKLLSHDGYDCEERLMDCGIAVFNSKKQDVHSGGSGCGCSAITLCGYLLDQLSTRKINKLLFCGTGALLSPTTSQQGLPIPGICHAVCIEGGL